jgi:cation diffusion facilitator CzcD-associated flavoprotein CzcO
VTTFTPEPRLLESPRGRPWPPHVAAAASGRPGRPPAAADVVVVGAGPAGLAVAAALWHRGIRDVVLLDADTPEGRTDVPCVRFFGRVDIVRQRVLRSPYEHHPGVEGFRDCELLDFARLHWALLSPVERGEIRMAQSGHRSVVPVDVFEAYCRHIALTHQVGERTWRARVRKLRPGPDSVVVLGGGVEIRARYVVLCLGEERRSAPADWWDPPETAAGFSYWDEPVPGDPGRVVVVGAGLSAAHLMANALGAGREVAWVLREAQERYQCSDVNAAFFRPEGRSRFEAVSWDDRRAMMRQQRRASVMFEFRPMLRQAESDGRLAVYRGHPVTGLTSGSGGPTVRLGRGERVAGDHVVLALGTTPSIGAGLLPAHLIGARDGWPDLNPQTLEYARVPRVFAVGAAAGMALGPGARNIDGHRAATARVAAAVAAGLGQQADRRLVARV